MNERSAQIRSFLLAKREPTIHSSPNPSDHESASANSGVKIVTTAHVGIDGLIDPCKFGADCLRVMLRVGMDSDYKKRSGPTHRAVRSLLTQCNTCPRIDLILIFLLRCNG